MNRLSRLLDRLPDLVWVLVGICIWPLFLMFGPCEVEEMEMTARETMRWQQLMAMRKQTLFGLLENNAPDEIVCNSARLILLADSRNQVLLAIWRLAAHEINNYWGAAKHAARFWWLMQWHGWPESCAIGISSGDSPAHHKKSGCGCEANFEDEIKSALRREQV